MVKSKSSVAETPRVAKTTTTVAKIFLDCKPRASTCCLNANAFGARKFGRDLNAYDADVIGYGISTSRPIIVALEIGVEFVGVFKNNSCNPGSWKTIIAEVDDQPDREGDKTLTRSTKSDRWRFSNREAIEVNNFRFHPGDVGIVSNAPKRTLHRESPAPTGKESVRQSQCHPGRLLDAENR